MTDELIALQYDIERKLGRNLLQFQRYEMLMKQLVNESEVSATLGDVQEVKVSPSTDVSNMSLGAVVKNGLLGSFITDGSVEVAAAEDEKALDVMMLPLVKVSYSISMSPERYAQTKSQLQEVVALRNEFVHHFLQRFELPLVFRLPMGNAHATSFSLC